MRWVGGRGLRGRESAGLGLGVYGAAGRRAGRRHYAVRARAEIRPICIDFARRPKSCGPDSRRWEGTERLHADRPQETRSRRTRPHCLVPTVTSLSVTIAAGESTRQAGSLTAFRAPSFRAKRDAAGAPKRKADRRPRAVQTTGAMTYGRWPTREGRQWPRPPVLSVPLRP